jgi:hypothetical protein
MSERARATVEPVVVPGADGLSGEIVVGVLDVVRVEESRLTVELGPNLAGVEAVFGWHCKTKGQQGAEKSDAEKRRVGCHC